LHRLGGSIDVILKENYESVLAMQDLKEALERIDSAFQFTLVAQGLKDQRERELLESKARHAFTENWQRYEVALSKEQDNITIHPAEDELVDHLLDATKRYRSQGNAFMQRGKSITHQDYYGDAGLLSTFDRIKQVADDILQLNEKEMKKDSDTASRTAIRSMVGLGFALAVAVCLAGLSAWYTTRATLRPIQEVTQAALGISAGNLDQVVPTVSRDELGQLAKAFNTMARHLRDYRQSQSARFLRVQRTSQATIDSFPDPIVVLDPEGYVEMANPAARRLLGVVPRQEGRAADCVWQPPEALREPVAEALRGQRDYLPESFDRTVLVGANGRERAVLPRVLTIRDPYSNMIGAAVLLQDVTRLRLLDQVKTNLVATVSHELKTPLTSIRLVLHLMLEEGTGPLTPKQTELLLDARDNSERLLAMVNNLLDLARLEQGRRQLEVHPEPVESLLQAAVEAIRLRAQDKGVEVVLEVPPELPPVMADASRLGHALRNLLDNSLTYTDRGGRIVLKASSSSDGITLSVADTGSGIPPSYLPQVFEKFFRVPGESRGSGTGLGLAIVNEIVTAHGGTISCESEPGAGTIFRLTIPSATEGMISEATAGT
jgi:signal transduction histidine kinase